MQKEVMFEKISLPLQSIEKYKRTNALILTKSKSTKFHHEISLRKFAPLGVGCSYLFVVKGIVEPDFVNK